MVVAAGREKIDRFSSLLGKNELDDEVERLPNIGVGVGVGAVAAAGGGCGTGGAGGKYGLW